VTRPLAGVRVLEYAQYVAGPLCGVLLADLGAEVVKLEPPTGDGYRHVMPVAPGLGRYFIPLNRGKRSVVVDLKTVEGRGQSSALLTTADIVLHNFRPARAERFGLDWDAVQGAAPAAVVGVVSSFGPVGPLSGDPAYDLVAQARSGLLTAHAGPGDVVPVRAGGIPMADLTAGYLLASRVLAALVDARRTGLGSLVEVSLLAGAMAVQVQDLVWLEGEDAGEARIATRADLDARAEEIAGDISMNPYYRCFAAADGFLAVACLNIVQRRAFVGRFELDDPTVDAPDLVPSDPDVLAAKRALTSRIEQAISLHTVSDWLAQLSAIGVPCAPVLVRETVAQDAQVRASGLVGEIQQPGLGRVRLLNGLGGSPGAALRPAPSLGSETAAVLSDLGAWES
jgi:crotonobetainyl-CoA:carnitine CoA-transferase CaiB-like acyl-CoA transferase